MTDMPISLIILWRLLTIFFFDLRRSSVLDVIIKYLINVDSSHQCDGDSIGDKKINKDISE